MFKKLVSSLPYSPSLLPQVSFYIQRLHSEGILRTLGVVFAALTLFAQGAFILMAPSPSIASDANDLVRGGLRDSAGRDLPLEAARATLNEHIFGLEAPAGLQELFEFYNITEQDIAESQEVTICSKDELNSSQGCTDPATRNYRSIGRERNPRHPASDVRFTVPGRTEVYYHRPLSAWDSSPTTASAYKALSIDNGRIFVLYDCGNIVFSEPLQTRLETHKTIMTPTDGEVTPGEHMRFQLTVENRGNSPAYDVVLADRLNPNLQAFTPVPDDGTVLRHSAEQQRVEWRIGTLAPGGKAIRYLTVAVRQTADDPVICNRSDVHFTDTDNQSQTVHSEPVVCVDLATTAHPVAYQRPTTGAAPTTEEEPVPASVADEPFCSSLSSSANSIQITAPATVTFTPEYVSSGAQATSFTYYLNGEIVQSSTNEQLTHHFTEARTYNVELAVTFTNGVTTNQEDCAATLIVSDIAQQRVDQSKSARVVTSYNPVTSDSTDIRSADINDQLAGADDIIEYTLRIQNSGSESIEPYQLPSDNIVDLLDYVDVIDANRQRVSLGAHSDQSLDLLGGGQLNEGLITWEEEPEFSPGETIEKVFYVQIKNPVPATNQVASNPLRYDCKIDNNYSNTITVYIACPLEKNIEQSVHSLPNTGPQEAGGVLLLIGSIGLYFQQRNRLLVKELRLIKKEYTGGL